MSDVSQKFRNCYGRRDRSQRAICSYMGWEDIISAITGVVAVISMVVALLQPNILPPLRSLLPLKVPAVDYRVS